MKQDLHQIFKAIKTIEPSPQLRASILARIETLQKRQIQRKLAGAYFSLAASLGAFIWTIVSYGNDFLQSDFWILLRLALSDASAVMKNWNDFLFSLLETFPVMSTTIMLIPVLALLTSCAVYFKLIQRNHYNYI